MTLGHSREASIDGDLHSLIVDYLCEEIEMTSIELWSLENQTNVPALHVGLIVTTEGRPVVLLGNQV